jgi:hypothetical protein
MFLYSDPQAMLALHHQRVAELSRHAARKRVIREAGEDRGRRFHWWSRRSHREQAARPAVAA